MKQKVTLDQVIESYHRNYKKHAAVARELGISRERVRQLLTPIGLLSETNYKNVSILRENQNKTARELSTKLGVKPETIRILAKKEGLKIARSTKPVKYSNSELIQLWEKFEGHYSKIAQHFGVKQPNISRLFKDRGLAEKYPSKGRKNSGNKKIISENIEAPRD